MYWDAEKSTYLPAPNGAEGQDETKKEKKDKEKVKVAKKIAKVCFLE